MLPVLPTFSPAGRKGLRPQAFYPECSLGFDSTCLSHPAAQLTVCRKGSNATGECRLILSWHHESRLAIVYQVENITCISRNNGTATGHCFQHDVRTPCILGDMRSTF
jgi:hypothetical protein